MRSGVADTLDAGDLGDVLDEQRQVCLFFAVGHCAPVGVDVLAEQRDLADALRGQSGNLGQYVVERARDLLSAGVGHDAVSAELAAAFHDRHEGRRAVHLGWGQVVEFLYFREGNVDLRLAEPAPFCDQLRKAMERLRTEYDVDVRRAGDDGGPLLAGDAAADANDQAGLLLLQQAHPAEVVEYAFLGLFTHRTGVEEDDVGVFGGVGLDDFFRSSEHVGHFVRIVLVHLAPEGADEQFFCHWN